MALPEFPLTQEAQIAVRQHLDSCANPGLVYERYVRYRRLNNEDWTLDSESRKNGRKPKQEALQQTIKSLQSFSKEHQNLWACLQERWQQTIGEALTFEAFPDFRFITGLGKGGPLEVGFTFHRIYGFPLIPGSGLKGLARTYALIELAEMLETSELDNLDKDISQDDDPEFQQTFANYTPSEAARTCAQCFRAVFGMVNQAGQAIFYDAIPLNNPSLELEVMTPHYSDYYRDNNPKPPADWQDPKPIPFLTVDKKTCFRFAVGWRGEANPDNHQKARNWLTSALQELGGGAKTTSGYGYFQVIDQSKDIPDVGDIFVGKVVRVTHKGDIIVQYKDVNPNLYIRLSTKEMSREPYQIGSWLMCQVRKKEEVDEGVWQLTCKLGP